MNRLRTASLYVIPMMLLVLTGCPKLINGSTIRIVDIDPNCNNVVFGVIGWQGPQAIGQFEMKVNNKFQAEFVIPQAMAQRLDFTKPMLLRVFLKVRGEADAEECMVSGKDFVFTGTLTQSGTDPRTGNPVYTLKFWDDFKIEYR